MGRQNHKTKQCWQKDSRRYSRKSHKPGWIYSGDHCWFKENELVYPASDNWTHDENIMRVIGNEEPIVYMRRSREGRGGPWIHYFESLGLKYVFTGSIHCFTKSQR
jgi:hypothetical protein